MKKLLLLFSMQLVLLGLAWAQPRTVTGVVVSSEGGTTLPQLTVRVKGAAGGVVTDLDGRYSIQVAGPEAVLVFDYVGMVSQEIQVGERTTIDVVMVPDAEEIGQVMVLGYSTRGKNQITGSSVQLQSDDIASGPGAQFVESLQGKVPGLVYSMTSSTPGSMQQIRIRGTGSIAADSNPLYVIDGVPQYATENRNLTSSTLSSLANLNPNDIESITLLKDASATAAYGARGSNGVIVIKTKSGRKGDAQFNFSGRWGASTLLPNLERMTAQQQLETWALADRNGAFFNALSGNEALYREYMTGTLSESSKRDVESIWGSIPDVSQFEKNLLENNPQIKEWNLAGRPNYDFAKAYLRRPAHLFDGQLSASGGGDKYTYYASLGANYTQNQVKGSDFKRVNLTLNSSHQLTNWLEFTANNQLAYSRQSGLYSEAGPFFTNPIVGPYYTSPFLSPYDKQGRPNTELGGLYNWLYLKDHDIGWQTLAHASTNLALSAEIIKGLKFKTRFAFDGVLWDSKEYNNRTHSDYAQKRGRSAQTKQTTINWVTQNSLSYDFTLRDDHNVSLLLLQEFQKNNVNYLTGEATNTPSDRVTDLGSFSSEKKNDGYQSNWANAAYLALLNYDYAGRYVLDLSYRREGSSRFAPDKRFGNFGSIGVAWNIHAESFFDPMLSIINRLRFRASWGVSGNSEIGSNRYQRLAAFEYTYDNRPAGELRGYGNRDLTWEKNATLDVGIEFGLLDNRITGSVAFFNKNTYDLLQYVPLSFTTGHNNVYRNAGSMNNRGVEVQLDFAILRGEDYHIDLGINMATLRNRVTKLSRDAHGNRLAIEDMWTRTDEGHAMNEWYLAQWAGVSPQTGLPLWYTDESRTTTTTDFSQAKRVWTGASATPKITSGLALHADWRGIYLNANLHLVAGHKIMNTYFEDFYNDAASQLQFFRGIAGQYRNTWTRPGDNAKMPVLASGHNHNGSKSQSDRFLRRGDYIRFRELTIGYDLPKNVLDRIHFHGAIGVYAQVTNLFTYKFDKRLDYDPEVSPQGRWEFTNPATRTFSLGLNVKF